MGTILDVMIVAVVAVAAFLAIRSLARNAGHRCDGCAVGASCPARRAGSECPIAKGMLDDAEKAFDDESDAQDVHDDKRNG